ncbi:MAG: hypothetical protein QNK35_15375 [Bacteroides sp.]|nr:hypothetical protein [Bacteroides sp.]
MKKILFSILFLIAGTVFLNAQKKFITVGYLSDMQAFYKIDDSWLWENTFMDRFNFTYYPTSWLTANMQFRSRIITGNTLTTIPGYTEALGQDPGWLDMTLLRSGNLGSSSGWATTTTLDRLWLQFSFDKLEITLGRQRINWAQTLVWNPNDIFNSYSYFEVDYPERPGSDAIRFQYYTGDASTIELVTKVDSANRVTAAAYYRFNALGYDIQFLGGLYQQEDLVLGTGWSGNIGPASFRGEMSYFRDLDHFADTTGHLMASLGFDHTFSNSLMLQFEGIYSGFAKEMDPANFLQFYAGNLDVKHLAFTTWSFLGNISYPITPLFTGSFAAIWYPELKGAYLGPTFDLSILDSLVLSLMLQYFTFEYTDPLGAKSRESNTFAFLRLKWNF